MLNHVSGTMHIAHCTVSNHAAVTVDRAGPPISARIYVRLINDQSASISIQHEKLCQLYYLHTFRSLKTPRLNSYMVIAKAIIMMLAPDCAL